MSAFFKLSARFCRMNLRNAVKVVRVKLGIDAATGPSCVCLFGGSKGRHLRSEGVVCNSESAGTRAGPDLAVD